MEELGSSENEVLMVVFGSTREEAETRRERREMEEEREEGKVDEGR